MTNLVGHISPETAYVVADYPYGYRLRCTIRYWIEYKPGFGCRLVSQTTNPNRAGLVWNKPKAGTYCKFGAAMYLDEAGHVVSRGLSEYCDAAEAAKFLENWGAGVPAEAQETLKRFVAAKVAYEANRQSGDALSVGLVEARAAFLKDA